MKRQWTKPLVYVGFLLSVVHAVRSARVDEHEVATMMLPSLKLHVTVHRKSMAIHGHSKFTIEASPVVPQTGDHVLYNSRVTFVEPEATFMYWLVHGAGYLTIHHPKHKQPPRADTIQCLPASKFPFHAMLPALNTVERIASASIGGKALECASGHLFRTSVAGARLVLCASGTEGFMAYSSDWNVRVEYVSTRASIALPRGLTRPCEPIVQAQTVSRTALALLTGRDMPRPSSRQLKATEHMNMPHWACECKSKPRPCIFFHGIGNNHEMETVQSTPENTRHRMGNMNDHAPCCSTVKYAVLDTLTHSWTTDVLQQKFCDRALSVSPSSDQDQGLIGNTILVTHSMANLVMAMALSTGKCRFAQDSTWVAISGPMMGSMAADMAQSICHHDVMKAPFELFGLCPLTTSRSSMFYEKGDLASDELKAMYAAAQEAYRGNVSAAMCGHHYAGLFSPFQLPLIAAGTMLPHKSRKNDGFVEFQSCRIGLETKSFGVSYSDPFYMPKLNHADTAFLNGDGLFDDAQKPVKWFECLL